MNALLETSFASRPRWPKPTPNSTAVDRCYRKDPFPSNRARVEFLFQLYEQLTAPLLPTSTRKNYGRV